MNRILIVDDVKMNASMLSSILREAGHTVYIKDNSPDILEKVRGIKPDIILLDIIMPGLDGFEVCKLLKEDYELRDIPVIMLTAKVEGKDVKHGLELGAFDYIKKPADEVEVIARVQSALRFKQHQDKLMEMSMKDGLTGIYNHALLIELFGKEFSRCERSCENISFVMLDVDHFKIINDTYGHLAGDIVLRELATILSNSIRSSDLVGRYGGEEFSIVFPEIDQSTVYKVCERIRKNIECYSFYADGHTVNATVSIGICFKKANQPMSYNQMIKLADGALYKAKRDGRNRVEIHKED